MKDKGFTLLELLVMTMILSILVVAGGSSLAALFGTRADSCANQIDSLLSKCKVNAMSRAHNVYLEIYVNGDGVYAAYCESDFDAGGNPVNVTREENLVGKSISAISYTVDGTDTELNAENHKTLYLSFARDTGAMTTIKTAASYAGAGTEEGYCSSIAIPKMGGSTNITLVAMTGKHEVG